MFKELTLSSFRVCPIMEQSICSFLMILVKKSQVRKNLSKSRQLEDTNVLVQYIYIKHNLFHQSRLGRHIELQNTHVVLFKSPRDVLQTYTLSQQLGLGSQLKDLYTKATSIPYGHLHIDLNPKTVDSLRFCRNSGSIPTIFFSLKRNKRLLFWTMNTQHLSTLITFQTYSQNFKKTFLRNCPKNFIQFLSECIVNLLEGQLQEIQKQDVIKYRDEIHQLVLKRTGINKRRAILSSRKGIELISVLTPSIINRLSWIGTVCFDSSTPLRTKIQIRS